MLRPKEECTDDEADISLSVTLLNREQLPSYSVERFYMLSEIDHHVHSTNFLCDFGTCQTTSTTTQDDSLKDELIENLPPYCILYLLWKHDMTTSPKVFVEEVVCKALERLQALVDIEPSCKSASPSSSRAPSRSPSISERDSPPSSSTLEPSKKKMRVYLVVDRCVPDQYQPPQLDLTSKELEEVRNRRHQVQVDLVEKLARTVATDPVARILCEGITVGVADHIRAAPGLEACLNALALGAADRRRAAVLRSGVYSSKSPIGIITDEPKDLLGLQAPGAEADAADGVLQCRIIAEWSGRGNLQNFSRRAHSQWRKEHNLHPESEASKSRGVLDLSELPCDKLTPVDFLSSTMSFLVWIGVLVYLWQNYGDSFPFSLSI